MNTGIIFDLRRYSIHDGPGIRTAVFMKGCPLACRWCHNPEGRSFSPELFFRRNRCILCNDCLSVCPNNAISRHEEEIFFDRSRCEVSGNCVVACPAVALEISGRAMSVKQVLAEIERDRTFYEQSHGGVTFTGGEPLSQPRFLLELLSACRTRSLHTAVDTSGFTPWPILNEIRPFVDIFLYDLKLMDEARHIEWTGVSNSDILSNLQRLSGAGHEILVRIPVIPEINDDTENINAIGEFLASLPHVPPVELLAFHDIAQAKYTSLGMEYGMKSIHPPTQSKMQASIAVLKRFGLQVE